MKNLNKRKILAAKVLGVGKNRIVFDINRLEEVKEAITKQDIRDLYSSGAIEIKQKNGRKKVERKKTKKGIGKVKKKIKFRKTTYVKSTRKLRKYLKELEKQKRIKRGDYHKIRRMIKVRAFRDKAHLKEHIGGLK